MGCVSVVWLATRLSYTLQSLLCAKALDFLSLLELLCIRGKTLGLTLLVWSSNVVVCVVQYAFQVLNGMQGKVCVGVGVGVHSRC